MSTTALNYKAVCPFYLDDTSNKRQQTIICEGPYSSTISHQFKTRDDKEAHALKYCKDDANCENCGIYQLNMKKYEE